MKWEDCNFLYVADVQNGLWARDYVHVERCTLRDYYSESRKCSKENCILIKICNKLEV